MCILLIYPDLVTLAAKFDRAFSELAPIIEPNPNLANHSASKKLQKTVEKIVEKLENNVKKP